MGAAAAVGKACRADDLTELLQAAWYVADRVIMLGKMFTRQALNTVSRCSQNPTVFPA